MSFKNHPSMKQRPISTRPILQDSQMSPQIHSNRPNTALGHSGKSLPHDGSFIQLPCIVVFQRRLSINRVDT